MLALLHDFDFAAREETLTAKGTEGYAPPEHKTHVLAPAKKSFDIWSLGVTALSLVLGGSHASQGLIDELDKVQSQYAIYGVLGRALKQIESGQDDPSIKSQKQGLLSQISQLLRFCRMKDPLPARGRFLLFTQLGIVIAKAFSSFSFLVWRFR